MEDAGVVKKEGCRSVKGLKKEEQDCAGDRVFNRVNEFVGEPAEMVKPRSPGDVDLVVAYGEVCGEENRITTVVVLCSKCYTLHRSFFRCSSSNGQTKQN